MQYPIQENKILINKQGFYATSDNIISIIYAIESNFFDYLVIFKTEAEY